MCTNLDIYVFFRVFKFDFLIVCNLARLMRINTDMRMRLLS